MPDLNTFNLSEWWPIIAAAAVLILLICLLIGQYRQARRLIRRFDRHERLMMDTLTELRRMTVTREEYTAQWQALSQQIVSEGHELNRSQEARFDAADARAERAAHAQDMRDSRLSQAIEQKLNAQPESEIPSTEMGS